MQRHILFLTALNIVGAMAQETANPLNDFISAAQNGAGQINSALSAQTTPAPTSSPSSSPATPTPAAATSSAAAHKGGLSSGAKTGIIVGVVVGVVFLIGLLAGICCCLMLRKRRRRRVRAAATPMTTEEVRQHNPTVPLVAAGPGHHTDHHHANGHSHAPSLSQHPAMRQTSNENPFTDNAHTAYDPPRYSNHSQGPGLAGATAAGAAGYGLGHHRKSGEHHHTGNSVPLETINHDRSGQYGPASSMNPAQSTHHGHGPGLAGATAAGAAAGYGLGHHRKSGDHHRNSDTVPPNTMHHGNSGQYDPIPSGDYAENTHHGPTSAMAAGAMTGPGERDMEHHRQSAGFPPRSTNLTQSSHNGVAPAMAGALAGGATASALNRKTPHDRRSGEYQPLSSAPTHMQNDPLPPNTGVMNRGDPDYRRSGEHNPLSGAPTHMQGSQNGPYPAMIGGGNSRYSGEHHPMSNSTHAQEMHHGLPPALAAGTTAMATDHSISQPRHSSDHRPLSNTTHSQGLHHGLPPAIAAIVGKTSTDHDPQYHKDRQQYPVSDTTSQGQGTNPATASNMATVGANSQRGSHDGLRTLPSASHPPQTTPKEAVVGAAALAALEKEEKRRRRESSGSRSRSRSQSRRRSGGLPTHTNSDRPPTPFGLSGIGQPYEDKHVSVLQSEPPSNELRHSLYTRPEEPFASGAIQATDQHENHHVRGYSTPPQVPSRSPNRANRASTMVDSSYESSLNNTTSSNSGESYQAINDPYKPATPNRSYIPPWERNQTRYSTTPPHSAAINPPAVPWEDQRRHSPRTSIDASGRRSSRSPATGINGQPRRLRFEDLEPEGDQRQSLPRQSQGYDTYDASGYSPGVGKAL